MSTQRPVQRLRVYLEHARHFVHSEHLDDRVLSHLWWVARREEWSVLQSYLRSSVPAALIRRAEQWALNMVLVTQAMQQHDAWWSAWPGEEDASLGEVRFRSHDVDLRGVSLVRANLPHVDLKHANLQGANLTLANLSHACLFGADLEGACLKGAHLGGASLARANLQGADLEGANLARTLVWGSNLKDANLKDTCLDRG